MRYSIYQAESRLGELTFHKEKPIFHGNEDFVRELNALIADGITVLKHTRTDNSVNYDEESVAQTDELYPLALVQWLRRKGYDVVEEHPELTDSIHELVNAQPITDEEKVRIFLMLPQLSFLEKTYLLQALQEKV